MSHRATSWLSHVPAGELTNSEFRVLFHLCDCHNPSQGCFPTQAYLMEATGVSNGTLNNALNGLEAKGLIARHRTWDKRTKKQCPTRYMLGFELKDAQEPPPKTGDGKAGKPSPKSGDGAVSNKRGKPSPISGGSRLQPTGEVTSKEPVNNQRGGRRGAKNGASEVPEWLRRTALKIMNGDYLPASCLTAVQARLLLHHELVSEDALRALGIAF